MLLYSSGVFVDNFLEMILLVIWSIPAYRGTSTHLNGMKLYIVK